MHYPPQAQQGEAHPQHWVPRRMKTKKGRQMINRKHRVGRAVQVV